jgi:hypothetical protein
MAFTILLVLSGGNFEPICLPFHTIRYLFAYYLNIINRWWGGHYPNSLDEVLGVIPTLNLTMTKYIDDTYDYYRTSEDWTKQMASDVYSYKFWKNIHQLIKTMFVRNQDLDEGYIAQKSGAWIWQFTPRRDFQNFSDTPVINARWILRNNCNAIDL